MPCDCFSGEPRHYDASCYCAWALLYLGEVDELVEEVCLGPGGAGCGSGQVEMAGNLGNQGWVAVVLAVPAKPYISVRALNLWWLQSFVH